MNHQKHICAYFLRKKKLNLDRCSRVVPHTEVRVHMLFDIEICRHPELLLCACDLLHSGKRIDAHRTCFMAEPDDIPVALLADHLIRIQTSWRVFLLAQGAVQEVHAYPKLDSLENCVEN